MNRLQGRSFHDSKNVPDHLAVTDVLISHAFRRAGNLSSGGNMSRYDQ